MTPWEWVTTTTSPDSWLTTLGVGTLAILFATNRILTRGQHLDRIADLTSNHAREMKALMDSQSRELAALNLHHERELAEKDAHVERVDESRKEWREAERLQRIRADEATATMGVMAGSLDGIRGVLDALHTVAKEARHE